MTDFGGPTRKRTLRFMKHGGLWRIWLDAHDGEEVRGGSILDDADGVRYMVKEAEKKGWGVNKADLEEFEQYEKDPS